MQTLVINLIYSCLLWTALVSMNAAPYKSTRKNLIQATRPLSSIGKGFRLRLCVILAHVSLKVVLYPC